MIKYKTFYLFLSLLFFASFCFGFFYSADCVYAADYVTSYSNVLEDLQNSSDFDVNDYPVDVTDYSLTVMTVGESKDNEVFVYVYQPCFTKNFRATCISMSRSIGGTIAPQLYNLQFINKSGTLYKYKVADHFVGPDPVRYYEIYSIFRRYDSSIDAAPDDSSQTINEVSFKVGKRWSIDSSGNNYIMTEKEVEVITVTDKFVGFVRYEDGFRFYTQGACDSHFVVFSTDKPMDRLIEADVSYIHQAYEKTQTGSYPVETFGAVIETPITVTASRTNYQGGGLGALRYEWERIETASDFLEHTESSTIYSGVVLSVNTGTTINEEARQAIQSKQWVLRFAETAYSYSMYTTWTGTDHVLTTFEEKTLVGNVTILRLYFETDGVLYNLGVVDNKQTGSDKPINEGSHVEIVPGTLFTDILPGIDWMKVLLAIIGVVFIIIVFSLVFPLLKKSVRSKKKNKNSFINKVKKNKYRR